MSDKTNVIECPKRSNSSSSEIKVSSTSLQSLVSCSSPSFVGFAHGNEDAAQAILPGLGTITTSKQRPDFVPSDAIMNKSQLTGNNVASTADSVQHNSIVNQENQETTWLISSSAPALASSNSSAAPVQGSGSTIKQTIGVSGTAFPQNGFPIIRHPNDRSATSETRNSTTVAEFLYQLMKMLADDNKEVIEWQEGKIQIHNPPRLASDVLKNYFRHSKYASFQRQLNYFGFRKTAGKGKMAPCTYINEEVTADMRSILAIKRKPHGTTMRKKSTVAKQALLLQQEINAKALAQQQSITVLSPVAVIASPLVANPLTQGLPVGKPLTLLPENVQQAHHPAHTLASLTASMKAAAAAGKGVRHQFNGYLRNTTTSVAAPLPAPALAKVPHFSSSQQPNSLARAELAKKFQFFQNQTQSQQDSQRETAIQGQRVHYQIAQGPQDQMLVAAAPNVDIMDRNGDPVRNQAAAEAASIFYQSGLFSESNVSLADLAMIPIAPCSEAAIGRSNTGSGDENTARSASTDDSAGLNFIDFPPDWDSFRNT